MHPGQDLLFQCVERNCQKPICEICLSVQHQQHSTKEIDEFIEAKRWDISDQMKRLNSYSEKMLAFRSSLQEVLSEVEAEATKSPEVQHNESKRQLKIEIKHKINFLDDLVQKHDTELTIARELGKAMKVEAETFTSLSLIARFSQKCSSLYKIDSTIRSLIDTLHKDDFREWGVAIRRLTDSKDETFYPHLDAEWKTELPENNSSYQFLCSQEDGSIVVAGNTRKSRYKVIRYSRLGEVLWEDIALGRWEQVDDILEIRSPGTKSVLLCCNTNKHEILKIGLESGIVERVLKRETITPRLLAASSDHQRVYVFDISTQPPMINVLDKTSSPSEFIRSTSLPAAFHIPSKMLVLPNTQLLLFAVYKVKASFVVAVDEQSGEIVWEFHDKFRGGGISLTPTGLILVSMFSSVICLNDRGHVVHEYQFEKLTNIKDIAWHQGFLMILYSTDMALAVKAVMAPCPNINSDAKVIVDLI